MYEMSNRVLGNFIVIWFLLLLYVSFKLAFYYTKSVDEAKKISWLVTNFISICFFGYQIGNKIYPYSSGDTGFTMIIVVGVLSGLVLIFMRTGDQELLANNNTNDKTL